MQVDVEKLVPGATVLFPEAAGPAEIVSIKPGEYWTFVFRDAHGLDEITLSEEELGGVVVIERREQPTFDADPHRFRLGLEARRISTAFTYEMGAVAVSNIEPLPHQLEAVYDEFLPQPRLRFLLADDPGSGKTIMAGLYAKELVLRKAGDRLLVVVPANLRAQWARELDERFQLSFVGMDSALFNSVPTENPWDLHPRVIVSRDFLRQEYVLDAFREAELHWDLAILDEAHGYTAYVDGKGLLNKKSQRYVAAEAVSAQADRLILMTATPHRGKDADFWALLRLLDPHVFGDRAPKKIVLPKRLWRRVSKESMRDMKGDPLFKKRHAHTRSSELSPIEQQLYDAVTEFVSEKLREIRSETGSRHNAAGFALTTMQRRLASSTRAIRRTLERRMARIDKALADPEEYLRSKKAFQADVLADDDLEDLDEQELWDRQEAALDEWLPQTVEELRMERELLDPLLGLAVEAEESRADWKLRELLDVVKSEGLREDRRKQLLIFTEHKDTLDYLVEELRPDFEVAVIHGGLKLAERIDQERFFREQAQILVATEAAGEGINLQFCHLMVNYDIPWSPHRLEQRMGRIHRIGQTREVHIFNMVAGSTREGYVLKALLDKLERIEGTLGDSVFDVIGGIFEEYNLRELLESVLVGDVSAEEAASKIAAKANDPVSVKRANELLESALATDNIDWQEQSDRAARIRERRLPPSYFKRFFLDAITLAGGRAEERVDGTVRVERTPDPLVARSRVGSATRRIAPTYARLVFDREIAMRPRGEDEANLAAAELCGPGHPLFDALIDWVVEQTTDEMHRGAVFTDPDVVDACALHHLLADTVDGNRELVHQALGLALQRGESLSVGAGKTLYDMIPSTLPSAVEMPEKPPTLEDWARKHLFEERFQQVKIERERVAGITERFLEESFTALLAEADRQILEADEDVDSGISGAQGRVRQAELAKEAHRQRRDDRVAIARRSGLVNRGPISILGSIMVVPSAVGDRPDSGDGQPAGHSNAEIEAIAIGEATRYEEARGATWESTEKEGCGFDLRSIRGTERRCIEVKGRVGVSQVELTWLEYQKALELKDEFWLYVVLECGTARPRLYRVQNPAERLAGAITPSLDVRFQIKPDPVINTAEVGE
jgi:superfamily II DNA or RNA helicase